MDLYLYIYYVHNYFLLVLISLKFMIGPCLSQITTTNHNNSNTPTPKPTTDNEGQYTSIYITMIIIFSILFVVVIFCLIYRIYKKRQEENNEIVSNKSSNKSSSNTTTNVTNHENIENGTVIDEIPAEQVKFRGSMSSVENRHERVPSKPVIIAITTPKGTRHVADAFGEYDGQSDEKDELPGIDENKEQEYDQNQNKNNNSTAQVQQD
eukprot:845505_1